MQDIKVASLIFDDLTYSVPSTVEEYNSLDPKRVSAGQNPVVEDAVDNIMKHRILGGFRSDFLDKVEEKYEIKRINHGTEKEPRWESDGKFFDRVIATLATQRGQSTVTDAVKAEIRAELRDVAQACLSAQKFVVAAREGGTGSAPVGKADIKLATDAFEQGKIAKLAQLLGAKLGREIPVTDDKEATIKAVALALKDNRKAEADRIEAEQRSLLAAS